MSRVNGGMKKAIVAAAVALVTALPARAASVSGDACTLLGSQFLPAVAVVKKVRTFPAPEDVIRSLRRSLTLRWEAAAFSIEIAGRQIEVPFYCAKNKYGGIVIINGVTHTIRVIRP